MKQVFLLSPLIITEKEVDKALDILYPILTDLKDLEVKQQAREVFFPR